MNESIRSLFPAANRYTYLNSASVSPMPTTAVAAVSEQINDVSNNGLLNFETWLAVKNNARELTAQMLGVRAEQIAFMRNTSDGFSTIANGLNWEAGDNIVSFAGEFPANFYPWRNVRDRYGVTLRMVQEKDGRIDLDEMISLIDGNTKIVALSAVQFASGFKSDLVKVGEAARKVDALFAVDIIQGFGATGFELPNELVDIAAGASHKWLCAPEGCGILYVSDRARDRITPPIVGWISVETPWNFEDREQDFKPNALAWESGTGPSSLFFGLEQSLKLLQETGLDKIKVYLDDLTELLCDKLKYKNYEIVSSRRPAERSAIVCVRHKGGLPCGEIAKQLEEKGVIVAPRGDRLRIAPHFYNNESDIDNLIEALP